MVKRLFDVACASVALVFAAPILAVAAIGIKLSAPGPIIYRARRVGRRGRSFTMFKLRTMRVEPDDAGSRITGTGDPRVFPFGQVLRRAKIDELPQLVNVLLGHMSIVGPRPEDPTIVQQFYGPEHYRTLEVRPGLASPGSIYQCTHGDRLLDGSDPEESYVGRLLHVKLALDLVLVDRGSSLRYDLSIVGRTLYVITAMLLGKRRFPSPPEMPEARRILGNAAPTRKRAVRAAAQIALLVVAMLSAAACGDGMIDPPPSSPAPPPPPPPPAPAVMVGAGDIAECGSSRSAQMDDSTALLLDSIVAEHDDAVVFTLGDNAYQEGTIAEYEQCYHPNWGRHKARTRPAIGNHEYNDTSAVKGYFSYFGDAVKGASGASYYSYDVGEWHAVVLDSEDGSPTILGPSSPQLAWLRQDLAASDARCTIAYWHHPRFTSTYRKPDGTRYQPVWEVLYEHGVDLVLVAHEHHYERFAPQTPAGERDDEFGIPQFVVGTGGRSYYAMRPEGPLPNSEVFNSTASGVLVLTLHADRYDWQFVPVRGHGFTDSGSGTCHDRPPAPSAARNTWFQGWAHR